MNNCNELRSELASLYKDLREKKVDPKDVKELTNIAGKMIHSALAQIKYYDLRKEQPDIQFLAEKKAK
jgi:hypothetical protein